MTIFSSGVALGLGRTLGALALALVTGSAWAFPMFGSTNGGGGGGQPTFGLRLNNAFDPLDNMYFRFEDLTFTALDAQGAVALVPVDTAQFSFSGTAIGGEVNPATNQFVDAAQWQINGLINGMVFDDSFIILGQVSIPAFVASSGSATLDASITYVDGFASPGDLDPIDLAFTLTDENDCTSLSNPSAPLDCTFQLAFDPGVTAGEPVFVYLPTFQVLPNQTTQLSGSGQGFASLVHNACEVGDPSNQGACSSEYNNSLLPIDLYNVPGIGPKFTGQLALQVVPLPATLGLILLCGLPLLFGRRPGRR